MWFCWPRNVSVDLLSVLAKLTQRRECLTDNPTRTIHNVRAILTKHGYVPRHLPLVMEYTDLTFRAHLTPVRFMFERKGVVQVTLEKNTGDLDKVTESLIEAALGADAEDFDEQPDEEHPDLLSVKVRALLKL